jgi:uncharacterized membrane protein YgcG
VILSRPLLLALAAALSLFLPQPARADERILHFLSDVRVERGGALDVTETIRIRAEGITIRHGIQRDFPTIYRDRLGRQVRVGFEPRDVQLDGAPVPWTVIAMRNGVRVRIGDPEAYVPPGEHVYRIRYATTRQIGFFEQYDELYWNATGTGWTFPIDVAEARIRLPEPAPFGQRAVYTGPQGSRAANAVVTSEAPSDISFRTTAPLQANEGLTVAVAWPKGVIAAPPAQARLGWWVEDNGPPAAGALGLIGVLGFYFQAWRRAGRGPRAGTVVPIFSPPDGLSAAGMRYVEKMGADSRAFAAALVELGVRGRIRLVEGEKPLLFGKPKMTVEKTGGPDELPEAEAGLHQQLFAGEDRLVMEQKNHERFRAAERALEKSLKRQFEGKMFVRNLGWAFRGLVAVGAAIWLVAAVVVLGSSSPVSTEAAPLAAASIGAFLVMLLLLAGTQGAGLAMKVLAGIAFAAWALLGAVTVGFAIEAGRILPLLIPLASLPVVVTAFAWMAAPTAKGRQLLDRIAGFRQYLSITEEERLERMHPPEKTPELFERYLPFAIALGVENEWADRFSGVLAAASAAGQAQGMSWYSGHSDPWSHPGDFADRVGSSLSSTVASASTAPGSSSGSGGGGSSGGGGGGGGGSGW